MANGRILVYMRTISLTVLFLLTIAICYGQQIDFKNRVIYTDTAEYAIICKERLHYKYYRLILFRDYKYYDCIYDFKTLYISELCPKKHE